MDGFINEHFVECTTEVEPQWNVVTGGPGEHVYGTEVKWTGQAPLNEIRVRNASGGRSAGGTTNAVEGTRDSSLSVKSPLIRTLNKREVADTFQMADLYAEEAVTLNTIEVESYDPGDGTTAWRYKAPTGAFADLIAYGGVAVTNDIRHLVVWAEGCANPDNNGMRPALRVYSTAGGDYLEVAPAYTGAATLQQHAVMATEAPGAVIRLRVAAAGWAHPSTGTTRNFEGRIPTKPDALYQVLRRCVGHKWMTSWSGNAEVEQTFEYTVGDWDASSTTSVRSSLITDSDSNGVHVTGRHLQSFAIGGSLLQLAGRSSRGGSIEHDLQIAEDEVNGLAGKVATPDDPMGKVKVTVYGTTANAVAFAALGGGQVEEPILVVFESVDGWRYSWHVPRAKWEAQPTPPTRQAEYTATVLVSDRDDGGGIFFQVWPPMGPPTL